MRNTLAGAGLLMVALVSNAQSQGLSVQETGIRSVARIFQARYFLGYNSRPEFSFPGDGTAIVNLSSKRSLPNGGNGPRTTQGYTIAEETNSELVCDSPGPDCCAFEMRASDGRLGAVLNFSRLTDRVSYEPYASTLQFTVWGADQKQAAVCDQISYDGFIDGSVSRCFADYRSTEQALTQDNQRQLFSALSRAFGYVFSNICKPFQLPPY